MAFLFVLAVFVASSALTYFSRFYLLKERRSSSRQIASLNPRLRGIGLTYYIGSLLWMLLLVAAMALFVRADPLRWGDGIGIVALVPLLAAGFTFFEAFFAIRTNAFPMIQGWHWDSFVYDPDGKLRHVAYWQIRLALLLLLLDLIVYLLVR